MPKKLTEKEIKARIKFHDKKYEYYLAKLDKIESDKKRIGFKHYD